MKKKTVLRLILGILVIATVLFIWFQSFMPASNSKKESISVQTVLTKIFGENYKKTVFNTYIRKIAHFSEYMILGIECGLLCDTFYPSKKRFFGLTVGSAVAICDEMIQFTSPGRSPEVRDVIIDTLGYICGTALVILTVSVVRTVMRRKNEKAV